MKKWLRKFEDMMAASAYAEAGEFETAQETFKGQRAILLALTDPMTDRHSVRYAVNACKRTGAALEIMYAPEAKGSLKRLDAELRNHGIEYISVRMSGSLENEIQHYTESRSNILFVVIGAPSETGISRKKYGRHIEQSWSRLKCPLVTVSKPSTA